ncbi:MAG TPA: hypothetical protein VGO40_19380 [Longimicrobium sp.]|nr:hypothetical protein [Longimicrobium sp.]
MSGGPILWRRLDVRGHESASSRTARGRLHAGAAGAALPRTGEHTWRYESAGGAFVRDLTVNDEGFVTRYLGFFEAAPDVVRGR